MWFLVPLLLLLLSPLPYCSVTLIHGGAFVGVNIGTAVSEMPSADAVVRLLQSQGVRHVRLYDANRDLLQALAKTHIEVMISVPNNEILAMGQSNATATNWVNKNVVPYIPRTNITTIVVGNEVITSWPNAALVLVSAMKFLHSALVFANLDRQVRVSTSHSTDIIVDPFPPSQAFFNQSYQDILSPLLGFLQQTGSFFMLNAYPYYTFVEGHGKVPLDYALFQPLRPDKEAVDPKTLLHYTNVFDALVDAAYFSMEKLNYTDIQVVASETGWPSKGDASEPQATVDNAVSYISNLVTHVLNSAGTPKNPNVPVNTYIYELYNEDLKTGPLSEQNWGLFYPNGTPVYSLHLVGAAEFLANDSTNQTFCIARPEADPKSLQAALDWACGPGGANCSAIQEGEVCFEPNTLQRHASFAFDSYYQITGRLPESCDFKGVAMITTSDPSYDSCFYAGSSEGKESLSDRDQSGVSGSAVAAIAQTIENSFPWLTAMLLSLFWI